MNGMGKLSYASGSSYEGIFKDNIYSGEGTYQWMDNSRLSGIWLDNCLNGPGYYEDLGVQKWKGDFQKGLSTAMTPCLE
jgi:hypothetical protein